MFQNNVRRYVFVLQIDRTLLSMFCTWSITLWKIVSHDPPLPPWKLLPLNPPSPSEFPMIFRGGVGGGVGMDIFCNHTILSCEEFLHAWHSDKPSLGFKVRISETKFCSTKVDFHTRQLVPGDELLS